MRLEIETVRHVLLLRSKNDGDVDPGVWPTNFRQPSGNVCLCFRRDKTRIP